MIGLEDRQALAQDIHTAHSAGARLRLACEIAGIDERTLQRWKARKGLIAGDGRPQAVRPIPAHALSAAERAQLLEVANEPRFATVPNKRACWKKPSTPTWPRWPPRLSKQSRRHRAKTAMGAQLECPFKTGCDR